MDFLNEARLQLESVVSEDLLKEYFAILRKWFFFNSPINIDEFDRQARKLLLEDQQIIAHNKFLRALLDKTSSDNLKLYKTLESSENPKPSKHNSTKNNEKTKNILKRNKFQPADFADYVQPLSPSRSPPNDISTRSAANELFMPDHSFISTRILLTAWENGLQGAEGNITDIIVNSCQSFVKNILTAMISRKKGYKIRDGKFQYGFNQPIPDPFLRNYNNVIDDAVESFIDVVEDDDSYIPKAKPSVEKLEQQIAFAHSCSKRRKSDNILTVKLLYDTLKENPKLLGSDAAHRTHLLKLNLQSDS